MRRRLASALPLSALASTRPSLGCVFCRRRSRSFSASAPPLPFLPPRPADVPRPEWAAVVARVGRLLDAARGDGGGREAVTEEEAGLWEAGAVALSEGLDGVSASLALLRLLRRYEGQPLTLLLIARSWGDALEAQQRTGGEEGSTADAAAPQSPPQSALYPAAPLPAPPLAAYRWLLSSLTSQLPHLPSQSTLPPLHRLAAFVEADSVAVEALLALDLRLLARRAEAAGEAEAPTSPACPPPLSLSIAAVDRHWLGRSRELTEDAWHRVLRLAAELRAEAQSRAASSPPLLALSAALRSLFEWGLSRRLRPSVSTFQALLPALGRPQTEPSALSEAVALLRVARAREGEEEGGEERCVAPLLLSVLDCWRPTAEEAEEDPEAAAAALAASADLIDAASPWTSTDPPSVPQLPPLPRLFASLALCLRLHRAEEPLTVSLLQTGLRFARFACERREAGEGPREEATEADFAQLLRLVQRVAAAPALVEAEAAPPPSAVSLPAVSAQSALSLLSQAVRRWPSMASSALHRPLFESVASALLPALLSQGFSASAPSLLSLSHSLGLGLPSSQLPVALSALVSGGHKAEALRLFSQSFRPSSPGPTAALEALLPSLRSREEVGQWVEAVRASKGPPALATFRLLLRPPCRPSKSTPPPSVHRPPRRAERRRLRRPPREGRLLAGAPSPSPLPALRLLRVSAPPRPLRARCLPCPVARVAVLRLLRLRVRLRRRRLHRRLPPPPLAPRLPSTGPAVPGGPGALRGRLCGLPGGAGQRMGRPPLQCPPLPPSLHSPHLRGSCVLCCAACGQRLLLPLLPVDAFVSPAILRFLCGSFPPSPAPSPAAAASAFPSSSSGLSSFLSLYGEAVVAASSDSHLRSHLRRSLIAALFHCRHFDLAAALLARVAEGEGEGDRRQRMEEAERVEAEVRPVLLCCLREASESPLHVEAAASLLLWTEAALALPPSLADLHFLLHSAAHQHRHLPSVLAVLQCYAGDEAAEAGREEEDAGEEAAFLQSALTAVLRLARAASAAPPPTGDRSSASSLVRRLLRALRRCLGEVDLARWWAALQSASGAAKRRPPAALRHRAGDVSSAPPPFSLHDAVERALAAEMQSALASHSPAAQRGHGRRHPGRQKTGPGQWTSPLPPIASANSAAPLEAGVAGLG